MVVVELREVSEIRQRNKTKKPFSQMFSVKAQINPAYWKHFAQYLTLMWMDLGSYIY